jgi:hypothetical protein
MNWSLFIKICCPNLWATDLLAIAKITQHIPTHITQENNEALLWPIMIEEVDLTLQDTPEGKSPGPGRLHCGFFPPLLAHDKGGSLGNH